MEHFEAVSFAPDEFKLTGLWNLNYYPQGESLSQWYGFQTTMIRFRFRSNITYSSVVIELNNNPENNYTQYIRLSINSADGTLPEISKSGVFHFTRGTTCAILNFAIDQATIEKYVRNEQLSMKFVLDRRVKERKDRIKLSYSGLANQGATCYLNSLLQAFFHLPAFRSLVYAIPIAESTNRVTSIPYNLQRLFANMQSGRRTVSTKDLTRSFGWTSADAFMQQDIQELCRVFIESLEKTVKNTPMSHSIADLFEGKVQQYIRCMNVDYQSLRDDSFYDLSLDVEGCRNLEESFRNFTESELLTGDNQYDTEKYGRQDAVIGTRIVSLPPVLQLHLRRFKYDFQMNRQVKVNDKLEFPESLNLTDFVENGTNEEYELFGVLVHSGAAGFGHYYAYIRPTRENNWYKFNDSVVTPVSLETVFQDSYGGAGRCSSAYLLMYYRKSELEKLLNVTYNFEPNVEDEPEDSEKQVKIITECDLRRECGELDLTTSKYTGVMELPDDRITKQELNERVANYTGLPVKKLAVWNMDTMDYISLSREAFTHNGTRLFVKLMNRRPSDSDILVFIKYFSLKDPQLRFLTTAVVKPSQKVEELCGIVADALGIRATSRMMFFKQKHKIITRISETTFSDEKIRSGTVVVCQLEQDTDTDFPFGETICKMKSTTEPDVVVNDFTEVTTIDEYITAKYETCIATVSTYENPTEHLFTLKYSTKGSLCSIKKAIADHMKIEYDPEKNAIQIYGKYIEDDEPGVVPMRSLSGFQKRMFFRCLQIPEKDIGNMSIMRYQIDGDKVTECMIEKNSTVAQLMAKLEKASDEYIAMDDMDYNLKILKCDTKIEKVSGVIKITKKPVLTENQKICTVHHQKNSALKFSPVLFILEKEEKIADTKDRLIAATGITKEAFEKAVLKVETVCGFAWATTKSIRTGDDETIFEQVEDGGSILLLFTDSATQKKPAQNVRINVCE